MAIKEFKKIGVGIDGSEASFRAFKKVLDLASRFGAEIVGLHILPVPSELVELGTSLVEIEAQLEAAAESLLAKAAEEAQKQGVSFTSLVLKGSPADTLAEYAKENDLDLLAVGYQGRSRLSEFLMGSVTSRLLGISTVPLLVVK